MYRNILAEMARCAYTRADLAKNLNMSIATLRKNFKGETPFKNGRNIKTSFNIWKVCNF